MKLCNLPPLGQPLEAGLFAGLTTRADGAHCAVVLLADKPDAPLPWKQAMAWAAKRQAELPSRPVAALLFANAKPQFEKAWHWTAGEFDGACAWDQDFSDGFQVSSRKSYEGRARAVRLIPLSA